MNETMTSIFFTTTPWRNGLILGLGDYHYLPLQDQHGSKLPRRSTNILNDFELSTVHVPS